MVLPIILSQLGPPITVQICGTFFFKILKNAIHTQFCCVVEEQATICGFKAITLSARLSKNEIVFFSVKLKYFSSCFTPSFPKYFSSSSCIKSKYF